LQNINIYPTDPEFGGDFMKFVIKDASYDLPDWYKKSNSYIDVSDPSLHKDKKMTIKKCMPVLDYLSAGINLHLPFAIYSHGKGLNKVVTSSLNHHNCKIGHHSTQQVQKFPVPKNYYDQPFKVDFPYYIEAPSGYSALFIPQQPYNDYPLLFPAAMVQSDKYRAAVNFPFFIDNNFEGKIDAGTLFMKVIFIKREDMKISFKDYGEDSGAIKQYRTLVETFGSGFYKSLRLDQIFRG